MDALVSLYFREYVAVGTGKTPQEGAVIFVCGPHCNQASIPRSPSIAFATHAPFT